MSHTVPWVILVMQLGCTSADGTTPQSVARELAPTRIDAPAIMRVANAPTTVSACNTSERPPNPSTILGLSAKECLNCQNLGYFLRELERTAKADSQRGKLLIMVPETDTAVVCSYLRVERVRSPVLTLSAGEYNAAVPEGGYAYLMLDTVGKTTRAVGARNLEALRRLLGQ